MAKDTFYFSHDYNTRTDRKMKMLLAKHGMIGYGLFWAIIEDLYNNANALRLDLDCIAYDLRVDANVIKSVIFDFDLFVINGDFFSSNSVERRLEERQDKSTKARESAFKRWGNNPKDANALQSQSAPNAIKERKGKENKGKESIKEEPANEKYWFLKFYHAPYDHYKTIYNGKATTEDKFLIWKSFIDFIYKNKYDEIMDCKFISAHDLAVLMERDNFTEDKWDETIKKILSTGVKPEHNLYFRIPDFMGYVKPRVVSKREQTDYEKEIEKARKNFIPIERV